MGSTGGATNVQTESTSDAVGHLMSHNPITPEGQAAMEPWSLANTMWFHGQFLPEQPGTCVLSFQTTESFEQTGYSLMAVPTGQTGRLTASEGYSDFIVPALIQESDNGPHYPEIRPAKRKNDEDLHNLGRSAKHLRGPGGRKGPSGVPDSCLVTFSVKRAQEPRKKTKNACLNCIWNRKGCSEITPCVNCLCNGTRGGIPQTLCIRENITELNIFKRSDTYVVWRSENTPIFGLGSFRDLERFWDRAYDTMVDTATWSDDPDLSLEVLGQYQFSNRCRHMIVFLLRFLQDDIARELEHYEGQNRSVSTAFARRLFAGIQGNIRELPKLRLEDFLDLLFELRCLEQLLEANLGFHGMDPDDEMIKHLQDYLREVVKNS
ncbi:hypothetical protein CEP52_005601 [Fusarium oligoseptatum]|uniref:Uncharacterized protein n=1 Tax=Fusarium oligoseptatum TaxID=2604345 RepID=A0A428TXD1_9HYPO|nr:hypothetical protein CEP52_005601 [Fusarium oligoseptatum]